MAWAQSHLLYDLPPSIFWKNLLPHILENFGSPKQAWGYNIFSSHLNETIYLCKEMPTCTSSRYRNFQISIFFQRPNYWKRIKLSKIRLKPQFLWHNVCYWNKYMCSLKRQNILEKIVLSKFWIFENILKNEKLRWSKKSC